MEQQEQIDKLILEFEGAGAAPVQDKPWSAKKSEILSMWKNVRPDLPIFITPIEKGLEIMAGLRGFTSGLSVPVYLLDTPYGKIPMYPQTIMKRDKDAVYLKAWNGKIWREPNPIEGTSEE